MSQDHVAKVEDLCRGYLAAMERGDLEGVLAHFEDKATATSPLFGRQPAREFYAYVMRVTSDRTMDLKTVFVGASDPLRAALHCAYTRTVADGQPATINVVDVFDLTPDGSKFAAITIIYDTAAVRPDFDRPGAQFAKRT